jgi:hypothetical protein
MRSHKVIEFLMQRMKKAKSQKILDLLETMTLALDQAEKFSFESVPYEIERTDDGNIKVDLPELTPDEMQWFAEGLIPMPAFTCWYEFQFPWNEENKPMIPVGLIIIYDEETRTWLTEVFNFFENGDILLLPFTVTWRYEDGKLKGSRRDYVGVDDTDQTVMDHLGKYEHIAAAMSKMLFYLTLMINSRSTTITKVEASAALNKKRARNDKVLMDSYRKVIIVNRSLLKGQPNGEGFPKRLHSCRSHKRHFEKPTISSRWMFSEIWGNYVGWWVTVIPRHFRGSRELGEITHDYIVR